MISYQLISDDHESLSEFTDIAVRSIDGFFLPIYEEDIPYIASQFALYNIKARLLGGDSWNAAELLRNQQRYVNGVVFFAGHFVDETELNYINFIRDFRIATSSSPGTMAIYGCNIIKLVLNGIVYDQQNPLAIINQEILSEGESSGKLTVVNIEPAKVEIKFDGKTSYLNLK